MQLPFRLLENKAEKYSCAGQLFHVSAYDGLPVNGLPVITLAELFAVTVFVKPSRGSVEHATWRLGASKKRCRFGK